MAAGQKKYLVIGTAGHVDHGKTELIKALTGAETDRLKEEKSRGISIDLGFARFKLPGGQVAGVIDVPGHERFIHNMLAGVGGTDLVLLVVDVSEGVMPQTREHLQILQLLGIQRGIIVLTKCDLVEEEWIDLVEEEVRTEFEGTFVEDAPCHRVSSVTSEGIPELISTIEGIVADIEPKDSDGPLRLPIDRNFTVSGFGTIVTGTLLSGSTAPGDTVEVLPAGEEVRVREAQVHGNKVERAFAGQRVALNLVGLDREKIERGSVVGTPGIFEQTQRIDVRLTLLENAPRPLKFRDPVHFYLGTARVVGLVALLDRDTLEPGESTLAQIHLDRPLVAHRQDRFIIRSYSPMTTIGGGRVIDPRPTKHKRFRDAIMTGLAELESGERAFVLQKLTELDGGRIKQLETMTGLGRERIADHLEALEEAGQVAQIGDQWVANEKLRSWKAVLLQTIEQFHKQNPLVPAIPHATLKGALPKTLSQKAFDRLVADMIAEEELQAHQDGFCRPGFVPTPDQNQQKVIEKIEQAYREGGVQVKNRREMTERLGLQTAETEPYFTYLLGTGRLIKLNEEIFFHVDTYEEALELLRRHFSQQDTLSLAEFRDQLGSARKQVQALLEHFDALKYTMRKGDVRIAWKLPGK